MRIAIIFNSIKQLISNMKYLFSFFTLLCFAIIANAQSFVLLNKAQAGEVITTDVTEHFFELVQPLEMAIQMKQTSPSTDKEVLMREYKTYLKNDVADFTESEAELITTVMQEAIDLVEKHTPGLLPEEIVLIKTTMNHYGPSVYYTRDNAIVIPANELEAKNKDKLLHVMLHEIAHIISRYNPELKGELYQEIGFKKRKSNKSLKLSSIMKERLLNNPDGLNTEWYFPLEWEGKTIDVVPLIHANEGAYIEKKNSFFYYLQFELFELQKECKVINDKNCNSTLPAAAIGAYLQQTGGNTQYIIHPDEILADNFVLIVMSQLDKTEWNSKTKEGQQLLTNLERIYQAKK